MNQRVLSHPHPERTGCFGVDGSEQVTLDRRNPEKRESSKASSFTPVNGEVFS
jgi:hypothetical protein